MSGKSSSQIFIACLAVKRSWQFIINTAIKYLNGLLCILWSPRLLRWSVFACKACTPRGGVVALSRTSEDIRGCDMIEGVHATLHSCPLGSHSGLLGQPNPEQADARWGRILRVVIEKSLITFTLLLCCEILFIRIVFACEGNSRYVNEKKSTNWFMNYCALCQASQTPYFLKLPREENWNRLIFYRYLP